ncbi:hypothetical protein [Paenibacillus sp. YAF4_2]|uniref:hypothetical protein n=1 Tax=Paenibacillus sp. YAF4_2 TaxID=3233085 RepID=UPI003F980BF8
MVDNDFLRFFFIFLHCLGGMPFVWLPPLLGLFESKGQKPHGEFRKFIAASGFQEKQIAMKSLHEPAGASIPTVEEREQQKICGVSGSQRINKWQIVVFAICLISLPVSVNNYTGFT